MSVHSPTRRPLIALWFVFFVNGAVLASWAARIPQVASQLSLSDRELGLALLGVAAGSVPALFATARALRTISSRSVCRVAACVFPAGLPLIALASTGWMLFIVLAALGAASGCLDVAMNTCAIEYQIDSDTTVLSRLHGGYSLGVLAGAAAGAITARFDLSVLTHFGTVGIVLAIAARAAAAALPCPRTARLQAPQLAGPRRSRTLAIPVWVGALAIAALLLEGVSVDWSALLIARDFRGGDTAGAVAVVAFSGAMFVSRSLGDALITSVGERRTVHIAAALIVLATAAGLVLQTSVVGAVMAIAGIGFAVGPLFPLALTLAGRHSRHNVAQAAAAVSIVGYTAHLAVPPTVGMLADTTGLLPTFAGIALCCAVAVWAATTFAPRFPSPAGAHQGHNHGPTKGIRRARKRLGRRFAVHRPRRPGPQHR